MPHPFAHTEDAKFAKLSATYHQPTTIQHWQLRDLVACSEENPNEVYCVNRKQVILYNTSTKNAEVVQQLNYGPTSMTCTHGYLATGGTKSELEVFSLTEGKSVCKRQLGGNVNNALHIGQDCSGELRLFVSNNDKTVKVFNLPSMAEVATLQFPVAINYASLSPDGKCLVAVGDSDQTYLYSAVAGGYQRVRTFSECADSGMCCSWNSSGMCFASASQDGSVCVWDLRSTKVLTKLLTCSKRACRVVKFSSGLTDLMAFTEHFGRFHIVDARTFQYEQVCTVSESEDPEDQHISGLCFTQDGDKLYTGVDDRLVAYDIDQTQRRSFPDGCLI